jgi:tetratricopeptide (TPR) repeat protein
MVRPTIEAHYAKLPSCAPRIFSCECVEQSAARERAYYQLGLGVGVARDTTSNISLSASSSVTRIRQTPPIHRCQVYTNLANQLDTAGRFVEAIEYWERALAIVPTFDMALGNRGLALERYARSLYDPGHQRLFLCAAYEALSAALSSRATYESPDYSRAKMMFRKVYSQAYSHDFWFRVRLGRF